MPINIDESQFPMILRNLLNSIRLKCENYANCCMVEIDYEHYRDHTKNCKFKIAKTLEVKDYNQKISDADYQKISWVNKAQLLDGNNNRPKKSNDQSLGFFGGVLKSFSDDKNENRLSMDFPSKSKQKQTKIILKNL